MPNLSWLGLSEQKVKETEKNAALSKQLGSIIAAAEEELGKTGKSKDDLTKQQEVCVGALKLGPRFASDIYVQ
ncbi:unnamed protein product [Strongylus vulgaris]|uniref:Uncharacterized protein n=1 Tax=Strongylus vulgaris TaxID=40348 RepID=A0A3P7LG55_STRVU|nr:unnamed protein product [Strongylus vulgaris]